MATPKTQLSSLLRGIRQQSGLTRRLFAETIGLSMKTVDNAEYAGHRVLGVSAIARIGETMKLEPSAVEALHAANDALAESAFMTKRREHWAKSNGRRAERAERFRGVRSVLVSMLIDAAEDGQLCVCVEGARLCNLCAGLRVLGLGEQWRALDAVELLEPHGDEARAFLDEQKTRFDVTATQVEDDFGGA